MTRKPDASCRPIPRITASGKFLRAGAGKFSLHGLTYGPFGPEERNQALPPPEVAAADLDRIRDWGANAIRVYHTPPEWFVDQCGERGLRLVVSVPWADHVDFLRTGRDRRAVVRTVQQAAQALAHRPEVAAILVGNEIAPTLVRWLGPRRVEAFLEDLLAAAHDAAPETLAAYANFPGTEFLQPAGADFTAFNVYLEDRDACDRYFARLQNLAGDSPLVITEFGVDAASHGPDRQAEILDWQRRLCLRHGVAGNLVFSYTDEWFRGGREVTGWQFGLTARDRSPRPAFARLAGGPLPVTALLPPDPPRISVIVCTRNGGATLPACLTALQRLNYPDYEVLVVDDGSTDAVPFIASEFSGIRYLRQEPLGLGQARNTGGAAATGSILAYTDDDCLPDEDWLIHLAHTFSDPSIAAAGGPNVPPRTQSAVQACVAAAPGGPAHVLLTDRLAEHLPGCNLAVRREAFERIGGFRRRYHAAGDDVDFCWRLEEAGHTIAFNPAAMVWHHRRTTARAYLRQQAGYGKAEALLMGPHPSRFGHAGGARWKGVVYQPGLLRLRASGSRIYTGVFGYAPFQAVYRTPVPATLWFVTGFPWWLAALALLANGSWFPPFAWAGTAMLAATLLRTARQAATLPIPPPARGPAARLLLWFLLTAQPPVRGWSRFLWNLRLGTAPGGPWQGLLRPRTRPLTVAKGVAELAFWSPSGIDRNDLLTALHDHLRNAGLTPHTTDGWQPWDLEAGTSLWWRIQISSVTEYHPDNGRLTRVRLASRITPATALLHPAVAAACLLPVPLAGFHLLWAAGLFFIWLVLFELVHHRAVARAASLTLAAANACGLKTVPAQRNAAAREKPGASLENGETTGT